MRKHLIDKFWENSFPIPQMLKKWDERFKGLDTVSCMERERNFKKRES